MATGSNVKRDYLCYYCNFGGSLSPAVDHMVENHPQKELKVRKRILYESSGKTFLQTKNFGVIPAEILGENQTFYIDERDLVLKVETLEHSTDINFNTQIEPGDENLDTSFKNLSQNDSDDSALLSPAHKLFKTSTPTKKCYETKEDTEEIGENLKEIEELKELIPSIVSIMKSHGYLNTWIDFNRMLKDGTFPMDNLAFQLFMDVCKFYACENSTTEMRFSTTVKRFWRIGFKLFHGKFLRFMSGPKHTGSLLTNEAERGLYVPGEGKINFAVPIRGVKSANTLQLSQNDIEPGILHFFLDKIEENDQPGKTYKLCLDGKKINSSVSGKCGDIDLWGYEHKPTLNERRNKLDVASDTVQKCLKKGNVNTNDISNEDTSALKDVILDVIQILSQRLKALREMALSKAASRDKLKSQVGPEWEKSNLAFVISSIITSIYDIHSCIKNTMSVIDRLCFTIACMSQTTYFRGTLLDLSCCPTYRHLEGTSTDPRYIKQRSKEWFDIRKSALVTGSTLFNALWLRSLKCQTAHFDEVIHGIQTPEPSEQVKKMMEHGSENEIHAVATLAGKILPVLNPTLTLYEEGCYPMDVRGVPLVISPDGSCRENNETNAIYAVEIKCPFPGNSFQTPVQYRLPKHYVTQVLAEMKALGVEKLYFISYSSESTAVHEVTYDQETWQAIENEIFNIYGSKPCRPIKRSENVPVLQEKLRVFTENNVKFVMEIPSIQGTISENVSESDEVHRRPVITEEDNNSDMDLKSLHESLYNADVYVKRAYQLTRNKASELLGFMVSDLDRLYSPEAIQSVPVAYGLKEYSLPTDVLRSMIEDVQKECAVRGIYVPVCSFDGQWCRLVVRDKSNKPLTVLQLQKDVFAEAKKQSKTELIKHFTNANVVHVNTYQELTEVIKLQWSFRLNQTTNSIEHFYEASSCEQRKVFFASKQSYEMIRNNDRVHTDSDKPEQGIEDNPLNSIDDNVLDLVTADLAEAITDPIEDEQIESGPTSSNSGVTTNKDSEDMCGIETDTANQNYIQKEAVENFMADQDVQMKTVVVDDTVTQHGSIDVSCTRPESIIDEKDFQAMLEALKSETDNRKWELTLQEFKQKFSTADTINKSFLARELKICVRQIIAKLKASGIKINLSFSKYETINILCKVIGDGSVRLPTVNKRRNPISLKKLASNQLKKLKKEHLNVMYAENIFPERLEEWYKNNPFGKYINVADIDCYDQRAWYSRPDFNDDLGYYVFMILDAYHQLCSARRLFCLKGIPAAGISNTYVHQIADDSEKNHCGLNSAMVKEPMLDKQSVAFAVQTFSEKTQNALEDIGATNEANFCRLIREWFIAEDEPGISAIQRTIYRLNLRRWLLNQLRIVFPPPGSFIRDVPIVLYEGLLTGIERRIQLYPFTKSGTYNVRSIGSLDIENFFGGLQDLDPRGTGVLRPDDIATAIGVAAEITDAKMNPDRGFHMTTTAAKVYPVKAFDKTPEKDAAESEMNTNIKDLSLINLSDHFFDTEERARGKRKRKLGNVAKLEEPVRRPTTVRVHHKAHEGKMLPHVRRGLNL